MHEEMGGRIGALVVGFVEVLPCTHRPETNNAADQDPQCLRTSTLGQSTFFTPLCSTRLHAIASLVQDEFFLSRPSIYILAKYSRPFVAALQLNVPRCS